MLQHNYNIKAYNTFGLDISCKTFISINNKDEYKQLKQINLQDYANCLILGGGSNLLFLDDFDGIIVHQTFQEIKVIQSTNSEVFVEVSAGTVWDDFVEWSVEQQLYGIENLSDIPGQVGASPVQNIGAYGVEVKDCLAQVNGYYLQDWSKFTHSNAACKFAYRDSIYKRELKNKILISSVVFRLKKKAELKLDYGSVKDTVLQMGTPSLRKVRNAIKHIRGTKLPNVNELGNAGSFFKNPIIQLDQYQSLEKQYGKVPGYHIKQKVKIPAAWLIDQCDLKGHTLGGAAVHMHQPLVLVNKNKATGNDIQGLAQYVIDTVKAKFKIELSPEVNIIS